MSSCLGLYIENNLIKYARITKERDIKRIDSFGVKFYDKIEDGIKQVIEETYSYKIPICINLSEESYSYFDMFALLSKNDLDKAIKMEFEAYCSERSYNPNVFETRYAVVENLEDKQKLKVVFVSENKIELNKRMQLFEKYRLSGVYPLPIALTTISDSIAQQNCLIINIEEQTTITTILNKKVYDVKVLEQGTAEFLDKINLKENSYAKAYEMCKETTIYTSEGRELTDEQTGYLEEIMPVLYPIVGQVQKTINESLEKIENVYITGTAALINNIDLYFQEYLENIKCELLKPDFIGNSRDINIKDYMEVNSAIGIALMGLNEGISGMNFKKNSIKDLLKFEIGKKSDDEKGKSTNNVLSKIFKNDLKEPLDIIEKNLLNGVAGLLILFIIYSGFSFILKRGFDYKLQQAEDSIANSQEQISLIDTDDNLIKEAEYDYSKKIQSLEEITKRIDEKNRVKGAIPGLLNQLMNVIPDAVKIKSIDNSNASKVQIVIESPKYEQIAILIGSIKTDLILRDVISTSGEKSNDVITVTIEGELP